MLRVIRQPRIIHFFDFRVSGEIFRDCRCACAMLLHAKLQGSDAAKRKPGVERRGNGTKGHAHVPDSFDERSGGHYRTRKQVVVPTDIFGCAVEADIDPKLERTLQKRSGYGIVAKGQNSALAGDRGHCSEVG